MSEKPPRSPSPFAPSGLDGESGRFLTTRWTMVLAAGNDGPERDAAMEQFAKTYWYPIYAFIRRRGQDAETARDLAQEFFAELLEKNWLADVERRETRFSTLLLSILTRFLVSDHRHQTREKRGSGRIPVSIDLAAAENWFGCEPHTQETPEHIFERRFALAVLAGAMDRLRMERIAAGRGVQFELLAPFLSAEPEAGDYARIAEELGVSRNAVAAAVLRLRRDYRESVREEIGTGLRDPSQVDAELRHLAAAFDGCSSEQGAI